MATAIFVVLEELDWSVFDAVGERFETVLAGVLTRPFDEAAGAVVELGVGGAVGLGLGM